ncbi:MAG: 30S ribosomal protein S12 methylthiotransferase RimO [Proteobacteria bacterium]|nr:30S ribosomal protein S12 methylthiotransferase RimO [Pseudomonadota bacterium]
MTANPPDLRPDLVSAARLGDVAADSGPRPGQPRIGMVSLGCPKALVDSERILTRLRAEGYAISPDYAGADAVVVNTCGFLDSAKAESLAAIGEALRENGRVIVTGCLGAEADTIRAAHPSVLAVTGPHQYEQVLEAVHDAVPPVPDPKIDLIPPAAVRLTPRHYAYLKISEGCNHACRFCIIPRMRGKLVSRPAGAVLREAERLVAAGVKEILVISQDTSAYGVDIRHAASPWRGEEWRAHITDLARGLGSLGAWVRLHYVYPYPHVDQLIPLMAEGLVLPYLDIPFQHAAPSVLRAMRRPANEAKVLERIARWREICPEITLRSTFIVGFPGEREADFEYLLEWLEEAQLDRVGCFKYENVAGAAANDLPDHVPEEVKQERWDRFMAVSQRISEAKLAAKVGSRLEAIVDEVDGDGATCRTKGDAPEIDGNLFIDHDFAGLAPGDIVTVEVDEAGEYDLWGRLV